MKQEPFYFDIGDTAEIRTGFFAEIMGLIVWKHTRFIDGQIVIEFEVEPHYHPICDESPVYPQYYLESELCRVE